MSIAPVIVNFYEHVYIYNKNMFGFCLFSFAFGFRSAICSGQSLQFTSLVNVLFWGSGGLPEVSL